MASSPKKSLLATILVAALSVSGSLVFLGVQMKNSSNLNDDVLSTKITAGIEKYVADQQAKYQAEQAAASGPKQLDIDYTKYTDDDAVMGDPSAPVTIIEFSDYQCPYCRRFYNDTFAQLVSTYIETGKAKLIFRDLPLIDKHPDALPTAIAANCAREQGGDAVYFQMHDAIFDGENKLDLKKTVEIPQESLVQYATDLGLDAAAFKTCIADSDGTQAAEVQNDMAEADAIGVSATPSFIINGWLIEGAEDFSTFQTVIDGVLAQGTTASTDSAAPQQ